MIRARLDEIKPAPPRDPHMASRGRAEFLGRAVSAGEFRRRKGWNSIFRKEQYAMNMIISILVIAGLLFGGGATVTAAQDDLPNEPLYALKVLSEDVSLQFRNDPEAKVEQLMDLAQIRIQEMTQLTEAGQATPDQVQLRLEQHIHQALQICSNLDDATLDRTLLKLRDRLQDRDRDMDRLLLHTQDQLQLQTQDQLRLQIQDQLQLLTQTRTMLRERLQLVEDGLLNHEMFRYTVRNGFAFGQEDDLTPPVQNGNGQQNGQPIPQPGGNDNGSGPGPNPDPGGPNTNPGGPNTDPGSNNNDSGSGSGGSGNDNGGSGNGSGSSGNDSGGSGGSGSGSGSGGNKP
jgi:hypothetical protein